MHVRFLAPQDESELDVRIASERPKANATPPPRARYPAHDDDLIIVVRITGANSSGVFPRVNYLEIRSRAAHQAPNTRSYL